MKIFKFPTKEENTEEIESPDVNEKKSFKLTKAKVIISLVLLVVLFFTTGYFACKLKHVSVEGTELYSAKEIAGTVLRGYGADNALFLFLKCKVKSPEPPEFISSIDVTMDGPNSVVITANEKYIMGYITNDNESYIYFDYDGKINEISERLIPGVMRVEGVECEKPKMGKSLNIGRSHAGYLLTLMALLEDLNIYPLEICYDETGAVTVVMDHMDIKVGNNEQLEDKVSRLEYILPQLTTQVGVLHLENFSASNTDIVFERTDEITYKILQDMNRQAAENGQLTEVEGILSAEAPISEGAQVNFIETE